MGPYPVKPLIKYVGGKSALAPRILGHIPEFFGRYHEPFAGGLAVFLALASSRHVRGRWAFLADANADLVGLYQAVQGNPARLVGKLQRLKSLYGKQDPEDLFYRIRDGWNQGYRDPARFVFLKQTAFNGLWRENRQGEHNAPWGKYKDPAIFDVGNIEAVSRLLQGASVLVRLWQESLDLVMPGDVVYLDPPYLGTFDAYTAQGFTEADHRALLQRCRELAEYATVIYSNQASPELDAMIADCWPEAIVEEVTARRSCSCDPRSRKPVREYFLLNP